MDFVRRILTRVTSEHGLYVAVAALAFMSSIVQLFVDVDSAISVKWLLATIWILLTVIVLLI